MISVLPKLWSIATIDTIKLPLKSHPDTRIRETYRKPFFANNMKHQITMEQSLPFALIQKGRLFCENIVVET